MTQHGEDEARFLTTLGGTVSDQLGSRPPRRNGIEQLSVPLKDVWKRIRMKSNIRLKLETMFRNAKHLEVHFAGDKCYVTIEELIPDFTPQGRFQFRTKRETHEYRIVPVDGLEVMEV